MIIGKKVYLRQLEDEDIQLLLLWENDMNNWRYSETEAPFSRLEIETYVAQASLIRKNQQVRFMICINESKIAIGTIDLFDIDFKNYRAGIGILISRPEERKKGYGKEALALITKFAVNILQLDQVYCDIQSDNKSSIALFEKSGFVRTGVKKSWYKYKDHTLDSYFYQKFLNYENSKI